jgi:HlyD family secretion protein
MSPSIPSSFFPGPGRIRRLRSRWGPIAPALALILAAACRAEPPADRIRASGYVEATDIQVAPEVGGRIVQLLVGEGDRVKEQDVVARLDTRDTELALERVRAEREQAQAQLALLLAGARQEDIRQAEAQAAGAAADVSASDAELASAETDLRRFEALLKSTSGSEKQRDDALTRRNIARERAAGARERERAAREAVARLKAGARREELDAARARVAVTDAQRATLEKTRADAVVLAPSGGIVTQKLLEQGEMAAPRAPIVVITDLDHAWANVFIDEPQLPRVRLGQPATILTDAGGRISGTVSFVASQAEFTPRNVQTAEDRSKLVYRIKITTDNSSGVLKSGMPVEAEVPFK